MNCVNCGTPLIEGNNTCPSCGALNMPLQTPPKEVPPQEETFEELDNTPNVNQVAETTVAPNLDVQEEKLEEDAAPIAESTNEPTYESETKPEVNKEENVNIDIPSGQDIQPVQVDQNVQAGGIGTVAAPTQTAGTNDIVVPEKGVTKFKIGNKTYKIKLGGFKSKDIILCVIVFCIGLFIGYMMFGNRTTVIRRSNQISTSQLVSDGKNNTTVAGNYKYKIPDIYTYDKSNDGVIIYDEDQTFKIFIKNEIFQYSKLVNAKTSIQQSFIDSGIAVNDIKELGIEENSYLTINVTYRSQNKTIALTDGGNSQLFYVEIESGDNNYNTEYLKVADDIIRNAEKVNDVPTIEKLKIADLSSLIITIGEADSGLKNLPN